MVGASSKETISRVDYRCPETDSTPPPQQKETAQSEVAPDSPPWLKGRGCVCGTHWEDSQLGYNKCVGAVKHTAISIVKDRDILKLVMSFDKCHDISDN